MQHVARNEVFCSWNVGYSIRLEVLCIIPDFFSDLAEPSSQGAELKTNK